MKTEDFDDTIKRKLESINPAIDEKDIERVHRYTVVNRSRFSMLKTNRVFWALMATGMLVTGLITWKLTSLNVVKQNSGSVARTESVLSQTTAKNPATVITKTDTVYIPKYINKYTDIHRKPKGFINNNIEVKHNQFAQKPASKSESGNAQLTDNKQNANANQSVDVPGEPNLNSKTSSSMAGNQSSNTGSNVETPLANTAPNPKSTSALKSDGTSTGNKAPVDKDIAKKAPIHNYNDEHALANPAKTPLHINFMVGAGAEGANTQYGGGVFARLILNGRISLNAGFKLMNVNKEDYSSDMAFDAANKGYNFDEAYGVPNYCWASDINMDYTLWQIPLAIEYDLPITKVLSFSISAGTDLDINCKASVDYQEVDNSGTYASQSASPIYKPVVFNNLVLSPGFIMQFGPVAIQLSGFVSPQIDKVWYKGNETMFYGGNLKVFYHF